MRSTIEATPMRTREQILSEWDAIWAKIASGCTNDGPRLWLECVLDDYDEAVQDAERRSREWRDAVAINIAKKSTSPF